MLNVPGGWTIHYPVSDEDKAVLKKALDGLVGVSYEPVINATQVVNGVNYIFIAESTVSDAQQTKGIAKIYVSAVPAGSEPKLINIERLVN